MQSAHAPRPLKWRAEEVRQHFWFQKQYGMVRNGEAKPLVTIKHGVTRGVVYSQLQEITKTIDAENESHFAAQAQNSGGRLKSVGIFHV